MDIIRILVDNTQKINELVKNKLPNEFVSLYLIDKSVEMLCSEYKDLTRYYKDKNYADCVKEEFERFIFQNSKQLGITNSLKSMLPDYLGGICEINEWKKINTSPSTTLRTY
jgi:hypothetical protein